MIDLAAVAHFIYRRRHSLLTTEREAQEWWQWLLMKSGYAMMKTPESSSWRAVTKDDVYEAAAEFATLVLDPTLFAKWQSLSEAQLFKAVDDEYYWRFLRRWRNEIIHEGSQVGCSAAQNPRGVVGDAYEHSIETEGVVVSVQHLPCAADMDKAREIFYRCLESFNRTEWPEGDMRAFAMHCLLFYDEYDWLTVAGEDASDRARQEVKRRYGIQANQLALLLRLPSPQAASILLAKARAARRPASGPGEPLAPEQRALLLRGLEVIISDTDRYR